MTCGRIALAFTLALFGQAARAADGYSQGKAGFGAWGIPVPLSIQSELGLQPGEGMLVLRVRNGATAQSLGIVPGDVVTAVNGTPISRHRDIRNLMSTIAPGDPAKVTVVNSQGMGETHAGAFKQRQPRRHFTGWNGAQNSAGRPEWRQDMDLSPDALIAKQYAELYAEQRALDQAEAELRALRGDMPDGADGNWVANLDLSFR